MAKSLTRQTFGEPSHRVLELNETSDQVAQLSEAGYAYKTKQRELEHQFEVKASELHLPRRMRRSSRPRNSRFRWAS